MPEPFPETPASAPHPEPVEGRRPLTAALDARRAAMVALLRVVDGIVAAEKLAVVTLETEGIVTAGDFLS